MRGPDQSDPQGFDHIAQVIGQRAHRLMGIAINIDVDEMTRSAGLFLIAAKKADAITHRRATNMLDTQTACN